MRPPPPPFQKHKHHFVPRFWQRAFAGDDGHVFARYRKTADPKQGQERTGKARQAGVTKLMAEDWVYTVFDNWWRPSDHLENQLAEDERRLSQTIKNLAVSGNSIKESEVWDLCSFVGLAACRTPEVMARGHRRMKELVEAFGQVHDACSFDTYRTNISARFGFVITESDFKQMQGQPKELWKKQVEAIQDMSPQNPLFPQQMALSGVRAVAIQVWGMKLTLLQAKESHWFILGDTPLPDADLAKGFSVPLTKKLALKAAPLVDEWTLPVRSEAEEADVAAVNQRQYNQSRDVVIGPEKEVLDALS